MAKVIHQYGSNKERKNDSVIWTEKISPYENYEM